MTKQFVFENKVQQKLKTCDPNDKGEDFGQENN